MLRDTFLVLLALGVCAGVARGAENMVVNGDFEIGAVGDPPPNWDLPHPHQQLTAKIQLPQKTPPM